MSKLRAWGIDGDTPITVALLDARLEGKPVYIHMTQTEIGDWEKVCKLKAKFKSPHYEVKVLQ